MNEKLLNDRDISCRIFIRDVAALSAGATLLASCAHGAMAPATGATSVRPSVGGIGLQLYTVSDQLRTDFDGTIEKIAQMGYRQLEFAGYQNKSPEQIRALLDRLKVKSPSSHIGMDLLRKDLDAQIHIAQVIGHDYITIPSLGRSDTPMNTVDAWKRVADECNTMGAKLKAAGLKMAFHSHTAEYVNVGGGKTGMDIFITQTDPSVFNFQMDLGWARVASQDPVAWFNKYPGRFKMWHVKDIESLKIAQERETKALIAAAAEKPRMPGAATAAPSPTPRAAGAVPPAPPKGQPAPVGAGDIDFTPILAAWKVSGVEHFFVEQDGAAAWPGGSMASIATSYQNLRKLLA